MISFLISMPLSLSLQGDADYLRYRGMQEFDQAMQHLEEKYGVCVAFGTSSLAVFFLTFTPGKVL